MLGRVVLGFFDGFTFYPSLARCDACGYKFPCFECLSELSHECVEGWKEVVDV